MERVILHKEKTYAQPRDITLFEGEEEEVTLKDLTVSLLLPRDYSPT